MNNRFSRIGRLARILCVACAALPLAGAGIARAQDDGSVTAGLVEPSVDAGQPAEYHIDITDGHVDEAPPAPSVSGLTITYAGQSHSTQITGGFGSGFHSSETTTYIYSVETREPGRYVIPSQEIRSGHSRLTVPAVTLEVDGTGGGGGTGASGGGGGDSSRKAFFAELLIPKKSAYVGESIPAEVRVYFGADVTVRQLDASPEVTGDGFSVQRFTTPRMSSETVDGVRYRVVSYKTSLTGVKTGTLTVGPVNVNPVIQLPRPQIRRRSNFGDPFDDPFFNNALGAFNQGPPKQVTIAADPVSVEIKPLPPGKPADFSGAIGQFKLEAQADPPKARTGDPVTVRLSLRGRGNFDRISPPEIEDDNGLRTYPATSKFQADDEVGLSGVKTFEQVLIPDGPRRSLPGYRFNYLDPATGRYETVETPPVAVNITGAPIATPTPAPADVAAATPTPSPTPKPAARDILYIRTDPGQAQSLDSFRPLYLRPVFWYPQGVLLLAGAAGFIFSARARRRGDARAVAARLRRQQAELTRALRAQRTGRGEFYTAARRLAQLKAAAALGRPGADLSLDEIRDAPGLSPEAAQSVGEIFHRHEELAYSGAQFNDEPVPAWERSEVIAALESIGQEGAALGK